MVVHIVKPHRSPRIRLLSMVAIYKRYACQDSFTLHHPKSARSTYGEADSLGRRRGIARADHDECMSRLVRWDQKLKAREHLPYDIVYKTCSINRLFPSSSTALHHPVTVLTPHPIALAQLPQSQTTLKNEVHHRHPCPRLRCLRSNRPRGPAPACRGGHLQRQRGRIVPRLWGLRMRTPSPHSCLTIQSANSHHRRTTGATRYDTCLPQHIEVLLTASEDVLL
jgi:hypothetical protein